MTHETPSLPLERIRLLACHVAARYFDTPDDRDDCVSELMLKALSMKDDPRIGSGAFVNIVFRRHGWELLRRSKRHRHASLSAPESRDTPDPESLAFARLLEAQSEGEYLLKVVARESERAGIAATIFADGGTTADIGAALDISRTSAKGLLNRSRERMRLMRHEGLLGAA